MGNIKIIMNGCTKIDKPLISILMAVYEPRMDWLKQQLDSLEAQTYPNLKLYIRDDFSSDVSFTEIQECVQKSIHSFPYVIKRNKKNLGSNDTFEQLTLEAEGEYFAYCDQDDIWLPEKLETLIREITRANGLLACSDMYVIDGDGRLCADSISKIRRRHIFQSGREKVLKTLLTRNFVTGCTMLIDASTAKAAIPFLPEMVHDHWLAVVASARGTVISVLKPLIRYRIHGGNQTGILVGVSCRADYIHLRVIGFAKQINHISERLPGIDDAEHVRQWANARVDFALGKEWKAAIRLWRLRKQNRLTTFFELLTMRLPEPVFCQLIRLIKGF